MFSLNLCHIRPPHEVITECGSDIQMREGPLRLCYSPESHVEHFAGSGEESGAGCDLIVHTEFH